MLLCAVLCFVVAAYAVLGGATLNYVVLTGVLIVAVWPTMFIFTEGREAAEVAVSQSTAFGRGLGRVWYKWKKTWPAYQGGRGVSGFLLGMWRERLTRPGRYVVTGAIATGIAGSFPDKMVGSLAFSFFTVMVLLAMFISILFRPKATVVRRAPERAMAGTAVPLTIRVTNPTAWPMHDVGAYEFRLPQQIAMDEEPRYVSVLEPGQTQVFEYEMMAKRRGSYVMDGPTAVSTFPFGLTQSKAFHPDQQRLVVYPAFEPLVHMDIPVGWSYQPGGVALASHVGESMEFIGTREYQPGDRIRDLHPKSWARLGAPVVRQYEQEFHTRVALLVDTYTPYKVETLVKDRVKLVTPRHARGASQLWHTDVVFGPGGRDEVCLDANLSLAAAIADYLARKEYVVDLFAAGPQLYHFQAGRSLAYLDNILDILACLEVSGVDPFDLIGAEFSQQIRQTSTLIALMMVWDDKRAGMMNTIREAGVRVKAILVSDDPSQRDAAESAGVQTLTVSEVQQGVEAL